MYQSKTSSIKVTIPGTDVAGPHFVLKYESKSFNHRHYSVGPSGITTYSEKVDRAGYADCPNSFTMHCTGHGL